MKDFFYLKKTRYNLQSKQMLKLPETSTFRYATQALCFKGSLIWNTVPNMFKSIENIENFRKDIKDWKPTTAIVSCVCNYSISYFWFLLYINLVLLIFIS